MLTYFRQGFGTSARGVAQARLLESQCPIRKTFFSNWRARIAGAEGGPHLRKAWRAVSEAISFSPELPPYFVGPYYMGPAHPMCADPGLHIAPNLHAHVFCSLAELSEADGMKLQPAFMTSPRGNVPVFGRMYRQMEKCLKASF